MNIKIDINNGQHLEMIQNEPDGIIEVSRMNNATVENTFTVSPGDMVTMLNWFRYQKTTEI